MVYGGPRRERQVHEFSERSAYQQGREEGREEGLLEGQQSKVKMMVDMIRNARDTGLSEDMIARIVNLDLSSVKKVINNEDIDIPLHLLAADKDM